MAAARVTPRTLAPPEASGAARGGMRGAPRHTGEERGQGAAAARGAHTRLPTGGARRASLPGPVLAGLPVTAKKSQRPGFCAHFPEL